MIELTTQYVRAAFDDHTGDWISLQFADSDPESLVQPGPTFDLIVNGQPLWGDAPRIVSEHTIADDGRNAGIVYKRDGLQILHEVTLDQAQPLLTRRVQIDVIEGLPRKLTTVEYYLPGLVVDDPHACLLQTPGQVIPSDLSYVELAHKSLDRSWSEPLPWFPHGWLNSAPDACSDLST